jgi:hypothetical protein
MPTARRIPSWPFRSSASITKMFTTSRTPAMIAKLAMKRNSDPSEAATRSAACSTSCFGVATDAPARSRPPSAVRTEAVTGAVSSSPCSTPPRLETRTVVVGAAPAFCAAAVSVPGETNALVLTLAPSPMPARPSPGTTSLTISSCEEP